MTNKEMGAYYNALNMDSAKQKTIDDRYITLLVAITKQAVFDYIHAREDTPDFISAKSYLLEGCFGLLESDSYMEELDRQRKEYWKVKV